MEYELEYADFLADLRAAAVCTALFEQYEVSEESANDDMYENLYPFIA